MLGPVRFSHLRAYGRSPMHGYHARTTDTDPTRDMERGTAVHALLFGNRKVCGYPGAQRRGKEYDAFAAANPDSEILTASEYEKAQRMADAVRQSKVAEPWLQGIVEKTMLFRHMGMDCRATPDVRGPDFLTELKTSSSADPERFKWHALRMHYHGQLRFQEYGAAAHGQRVDHHIIVCVESAEPYPVTVFFLQPRALEQGEKLLTLWMERLKNCEQSGEFPPYCQTAVPLDVPEDADELVFAEEA